MKAKDQSLIPASTRNAYGPSTTAVPPTVNLIEERVRRRAALDSTLQPSERGLGSRYRRQLLEAVTNSAYSTAHKKRTPGSEGRQAVEYHNQSMDAPLLFYLPSDGGLSATCITCAPKPLSLSSLCADNEMCAFCLNPFEPTMKLLSPAYIAGMQRRRDKDKKSRAAKRRKLSGDSYTPDSDFESDVFKSAKYLVSKTVGTVSYALHQQCAFAVDNGGLAGIAALALKAKQQSQYQDAEQFPHHHSSVSPSASPRSRSISSHTQSHSHSHSESSTDRVFKGIDLGDFYECDETDDAECDLCGRAGGIMQFFDLDSNFSSLPPPGEEGWLGHVPCISWLVSSKLLELPPSFLCKRGFLTGEISAVNFNSHSPLKRSDSKDYATDSPIVNGYLELNRSTSCTADMRAEEAEGSNESEMDAEQRRDEAAATSIYDNTCNDSRRRETVENAMLSSGGEMSADDVESSTASSCLYQTATDGVCVSEELTREHSLLPPELTITADKDSEAGDISTTNMHDTSPNVTVTATATATASSLKRASPDTSDQQPHQDHHKKGTPKSSPSLKRPKTSSTTDNRIHSAEKPSGDSIDYWSAGNNTQDKSDKGSVISTLIQNRQESLMQESTLQSEMPIVSGGNLEVLTLQLDLVSAALPHPGTVPETANTSSQALHSSSSPSSSIQTSYAPFNPQAVDSFDPTGPYSPTGQTRDTARMQPSSSRRDQPDERPLSLFDSLVGQWRCSCCGTYAGVVLKCSAVACTVRAHPLCVSIAGSKWTAFEASSSSLDLNQSGHASQTALGFLCALHSPQGGE